jgi:quinol-cytochrome oxidoreductase complex cytochrome b subunit
MPRKLTQIPAARRRAGRSVWAFVGFLALFCILIFLLSNFYLPQALSAFKVADERGRRLLALHALLLMCAILVILGLSLILFFRIGQYFFPRNRERLAKTQYTDAWAESAKRMKTPEK